VRFSAQLVAALAASHKRDVAHRDIKPDNIRFDEFGTLKVTDYGIAKARANAAFGQTFRQAGSPPYTPPEADDGTYSFSRDTYSWAAIALRCLTGISLTNYDDLEKGLSALSPTSAPVSILKRCLSLDPKERPVNGTDLQAQLESFHTQFTAGRALQITIQIGQRELHELSQKLGDRSPQECVQFLELDLSGSLHAHVVSEEERTVRLLGASVDLTCRSAETNDSFRISSVRLLEQERADGERRQAAELTAVTVRVLGPLAQVQGAASRKAFWLRLQAEEGHRQRERDRVGRERWFECWAAVLREKDRIQRDRRLRIPFVAMRQDANNIKAICEGEVEPEGFPESLVYRQPDGRHLIFDVLHIFGDEITLGVRNLERNSLPRGAGVLESNYYAQNQPVSRQRAALESVRQDRSASPDLKELICDPSAAKEPEQGGIPEGFAKDLNIEKRKVLELALGINSVLVIEGPPGTGKTTFIAELVRLYLHVFPKARILLSSQTHTALDHVIVKLLENGMGGDVVRIHGERLEKIDDRVRELTLDRKTRAWIERVEERAREFVRTSATQIGLNATDLEIAVLGGQLHILLAEIRGQEKELAALANSISQANGTGGKDVDLDAVSKTSTLLDEQAQVIEQIKTLRSRKVKLKERLKALGEFGEAVASTSDEVSKEWIDVLSKNHVAGADELKAQVQLQLDWFARLGVSRDFHGAVLGEARVVAGTCVGLGNIQAIGEQEFDLCIVDEVSKATPTETLIPMSRSKRWVLVGDPKQLPPFAELGRDKGFDSRFSAEEVEATLLDILTPVLPDSCKASLTEQRRMVSGIGRLISDVFYDGRLKTIRKGTDRNAVVARLHPREVQWHTTSALAHRGEREFPGKTYRNLTEATIIFQILDRLNTANRGKARLSVAVIAGYSAQVNELAQRVFRGTTAFDNIDININTVDAFQGKDADVCIYGVTRSNDKGRLGFQREARRLNVALSRGRDALIIVGDEAFCRGGGGDNPFRAVLAHIDNHTAECAIISYDRL
jgi:hypothetical protein